VTPRCLGFFAVITSTVGMPVTRHPPCSPGRAVCPPAVPRLYSRPRCKAPPSSLHSPTADFGQAPALPIDQGAQMRQRSNQVPPTLDSGSHINAKCQPRPKAGAQRSGGCRASAAHPGWARDWHRSSPRCPAPLASPHAYPRDHYPPPLPASGNALFTSRRGRSSHFQPRSSCASTRGHRAH
jgi:hypothetical protein